MEYSISNHINTSDTSDTSDTTFTCMNIINLDEIETHYGEIFSKINSDKLIYIFQGSIFKKEDNCNLFLKYLMRVIEYYYDTEKQMTIIMNLEDMDKKALNIDFIMKFVKKFKKKYENKMILRKFYILHCPSSFKNIYNFIKPFLHPETNAKISLISKTKSKEVEYYYEN
jgi:hypothetical protein